MARQVVALGRELGAPVGAVLEGGYDLGALAGSTVATLRVLSDTAAMPGSHEPDELTRAAAARFQQWWPVTA
jgi:acetoin utilization deacetylase AcuC-like enzyme